MTKYIDIIFDGPPGPDGGRFVEVEDDKGESLAVGHWTQRKDGYWALRLYKGHTHVAGTTVGKHIDECARCGCDLRHPVHSAQNQVFSSPGG